MSLSLLLSFTDLTCPFLCTIQFVSTLLSLTFFHCLKFFFHLQPLGSECPSLAGFLCCPDLNTPTLCSLGSVWCFFAHFLLLSWPVPSYVLSSMWVTLTYPLSLAVLTCSSLCALQLQEVSVSCLLTFCHYSNLSLLSFPASECLLLAQFLLLSWLVPPSVLFSSRE